MLLDPALRSAGQDKSDVWVDSGVWRVGEGTRLGPSVGAGEGALVNVTSQTSVSLL